MPASIPVSLPPIAFSKNYLPLSVVSDDYRAAAPVKSVNFLQFTGAIAADVEYTLGWTGSAAIMTAAVAPDNTGNQFPTGAGDWAYVQTLVEVFQAHVFIDRAYVVTADNTGAHPRLIFTAKAYGPGNDFIGTNAGASGIVTNGVTDEPLENFAHTIELWIANAAGTDFALAYEANVPLDEPQTGASTIDIHEQLHAFLYLAIDRPVLAALYAACPNTIRPYFVKFAQYYGPVPFIHKISRTDPAYIAKGGLGMQAALKRDIIAELCPVTGHRESDRFLRQGSINKLVTQEQPEWLTWINLTGADQTIQLELKVFNDDETNATFYPVEISPVGSYQKLQFQAGYTQLGIAGLQEDKMPVYYTLRIKTAGGYLTAAYAYVIDYQYREWPRYFVYENSYGAYQTIATVGKGQAEYDRLKDDAQLATDMHTAAIAGEFMEINIYIQERFNVAIGYDRSGNRNTALLRDFLRSGDIYLFDPGSITLIPIGLNTKNLKDAPDGLATYANSFEYFYKYQEQTYTEDPAEVTDDSINELLGDAGSPLIIPAVDVDGHITVEWNDTHLSILADQQKYTAPSLVGKTNYRIYNTQNNVFFRSEDISYNAGAGSFTILVPGFVLGAGDQLIIFPNQLNPDE